jgi:hypothetical protein
MAAAKTQLVVAKDSFATSFRRVRRGDILPADDPIVVAKPRFFAPYEPAKGR